MSRLLRQFTSAVDSLELTLVSQDDTCEARIISHDLQQPQEQFLPMWQEKYQLAIPLNHSLALNPEIEIKDLADVAFIQRNPCEGWQQLQQVLNKAGANLDIRARIQTVEYALGLVKAGLGCAFIPVSAETMQDNEISFKPLKGLSIIRQIGLGYTHTSSTIDILKNLVSSI